MMYKIIVKTWLAKIQPTPTLLPEKIFVSRNVQNHWSNFGRFFEENFWVV